LRARENEQGTRDNISYSAEQLFLETYTLSLEKEVPTTKNNGQLTTDNGRYKSITMGAFTIL
jgi:hypothetical protein